MGFREAIYQNVDIFGTMSHTYLMSLFKVYSHVPCQVSLLTTPSRGIYSSVISYVIPLLDLHEVPNNIVQLSTMDRVVGGMTG